VERFLASLIATHTGIITSASSSGPYEPPSHYNRTLPYQSRPKTRIRSFGNRLESHELSAQIHLTSELLRFL
jgi:hypothetical protein